MAASLTLTQTHILTLTLTLALTPTPTLTLGYNPNPSPSPNPNPNQVPQHSLALYSGTIACFGVGMGLTVAPTTNLMVKGATARGHAMSDVADALATLTNVAMASGAIVGPLLAGLVVQLGGAYDGLSPSPNPGPNPSPNPNPSPSPNPNQVAIVGIGGAICGWRVLDPLCGVAVAALVAWMGGQPIF